MSMDKPCVLMQMEGTYPFVGGGVSTWCHILCQELQTQVDYILYAITGDPFVEPRYQLGSNIRSIIHIPLWSAEEPSEYYDPETPFSRLVERRNNTTGQAIETYFFPILKDFLDVLVDPFQPAKKIGEVLYGFWAYYQHFDYKYTLTHPLVWETFKTYLEKAYAPYLDDKTVENPNTFDMVFGLRWFYHFMMPLAVPVPHASVSHATLAGFTALASVVGKYAYGMPVIVTDHGVFVRERLIAVSNAEFTYFSKKLLIDLAILVTRAVYAHADQISPVAGYNMRWESKFEAARENTEVIYNGIDPNTFLPAPKPEHTRHRPTVVAAARVFPLKDIETMIRSCDVARRQIPDVHYIVYGNLDADPPYTEKCRQLITELGVEDNFTFGGFHDNPPMIYNEGDISILSSISEGFPYTIIESMSCARPVVSTDVGGTSEAVGDCGVITKPRDPEALGQGVVKLLSDDQMRLEMGRKARERVLLHFTTGVSVDAYLNSYQKYHDQVHQPLKHNIALPSVRHLMELWPDE